MELGNILYANLYEIKDLIIDNKITRPVTPLEGQIIFNDVSKRLEYWSGTDGWISLNPAGVQNITLQGDINGSGSSIINTTAQPEIITNKPLTTDLSPLSGFLYYDVNSDELSQLQWDTINNWVIDQITNSTFNYDLTVEEISGGASINLVSTLGTDVVPIIGKSNEVDVAVVGGQIQVSLPDDIVINSLNVIDLIVNGVPYVPYTHPTHTPVNIDASGITFIQDFISDGLGHVLSVSTGVIPSASTTTVGVVRKAETGELINTNTTTVTTPADVYDIVNLVVGLDGGVWLFP